MTYRSHKGINWSTLKYMKESPADYKLKKDFPFEATDAMQLGTLIHTMLLEPDTVDSRYVVIPKMDMRKKESKERYAELVETAGGKILVPEEPASTSKRFSWSVAEKSTKGNLQKPIMKRILSSMEVAEWEVFTTCKHTGLSLKGMLDCVTAKALVDIKTINTIGKMFYNIKAFDYIGQLAYYRYLLECAGEKPREKAMIAFVETTSPHKLRVVDIDPRALDAAHKENLRLLERVAECMEHNDWPDDSDQIVKYEYKGRS